MDLLLIGTAPGREPIVTGTAASTANGELESFVRAAAIVAPSEQVDRTTPTVVTESPTP